MKNQVAWLVAMVAITALAAHLTVPHLEPKVTLVDPCAANIEKLERALDAYAQDWDGHHPRELAVLTPRYLPSLPVCPELGTNAYRHLYRPTATGYELACPGPKDTPSYPHYVAARGLIERP